MKRMTRIGLTIAGIALLFTAGAFADSEFHGRVSFADESGLIKGQEDTDWSYASLNSLVMPGDTIWADDNGALEMEFSGGTFVRLADGSRLNVLDVPPNGLFRGDIGSFYIQRVSRSNGDVIFDSPVGSIIVEPDTQVRIDILDGGATTVTVRWGRTLVHTADSAPVSVNAGTRSYIDPGYLPSDPVGFDRSEEDSFDTWNRERGRYLAQGSGPAPIDYGSSAPLGVSDLGSYGEWVYVDNSPYWRPTVVVGYVPYRYGTWSYIPRHGYVWCDSYPFAYTTTHYGYWRHHPRYGWIWSYSGYYRPAYAYTVSYGDYFVWAPLAYNGYPCYSSAYAGFTIGNVSFAFGWSSYAYHYDVFHCRPSVLAVNYNFIYDSHHNHRYRDYNYWRIEADARPYRDAGRPHWPGRERTYQPDQIYRGVTLASDSTRPHAPDRARQLESRRTERTNRAQVASARPTRTTPVDRTMREASVRDARVTSPSIDRLARNNDRTAPGVANRRTRTFDNDNVRGGDNSGRGSIQDRPSNPSDRRSIDTSPRGSVARPDNSDRSRTQPIERTPRTSNRPEVGDRVQQPTARPVVPQRPTTTRPEVTRPNTDLRTPQRPSTDRNIGDRTTRPEVIRPNTDRTTPQRPSVSRGPGDRTSAPEVIRPSAPYSRPQTSAPQRPNVSPESTRRQVTVVQRPTVSRPSSLSRQEFSQPTRPSAPSRQEFSQPSRPSAPSRQEFSQPSRPSSPAPSYSAPSRPSSPSPRISAPSRSSSSSFSSRGSSNSSSRGPSRSNGRGNN